MSIVRTAVYSHANMVSWLQENAVPSLFSSLDYTEGVLTGYDSNNEAVFQWTLGNGSSGTGGTVKMYRVAGDSTSAVSVSNIPSYSGSSMPIYLFKCDGGVFITQYYTTSGYSYLLNLIMTKNNRLKNAFVLNASQDGSNASWTSRIYPVAVGDRTGSITAFSFSTSSQLQTQFVPFMTYAQADDVSYTPCAFYIPAGEYYSIKKGVFASDSGRYVTNGYIALKDAVVIEDT